MYKTLLVTIFVSLVFNACSYIQPQEDIVKSNVKVFKQEDALILFALRSEELKNYVTASALFDELYNKSNKKEYLYRSLKNKLYLKKYDEITAIINEVSKNNVEDFYLQRIKILVLVQQHKTHEAKRLAITLLEASKEVTDYILVSEILTALKEYDLAIKYLESAYLDSYDEKILNKMSIILYVNLKRKKDAIAYLETHTRVHGNSELICKRLISIYSNENNFDGLLSTYLKYYQIKPSKKIAKQIIQLYAYKKEYHKIIVFLEDSNSDDEILLQLYVTSKNYKKAYPLAKKLYDKTGETKYLGESVIYEYESNINKLDKLFLLGISKKFENLLDLDDSSHLLNYYGYILIDHDIDVKKGMSYIQKALKREPNSAFYLDSLAWGHYKDGKCGDSLKVINKVLTLEGGDDPEVLKHLELIKRCKGKNNQ